MPHTFTIQNKNNPFNIISGQQLDLSLYVQDGVQPVPVPISFQYDINGAGISFPDGTQESTSHFTKTLVTQTFDDSIVLRSNDNQPHLVSVQVTSDINGDMAIDSITVQIN